MPAFLALRIAAVVATAAFVGAAHAGGALYRVERAGVPPSYLYGTLHSADPRVARIDAAVADALAASRRYAPELVMGEGDLEDFLAGASYEDGRRLADALDAGSVVRARAALQGRGIDDGRYARLKPWALFLMLVEPPANASSPTLDALLLDLARRRGLVVIGLELPEEQIASFDVVPVDTQAALVRWALDHRGDLGADHERTVAAWLAGDLAALKRESRAPGRRDPAIAPHFDRLTRHLIDDRNALLAHRLYLPLRAGRVFVAVGALHLDGPKGLVALLREQGYRVRRVKRRRGGC
jgi:uncharacterized protein YbaP (TraB family)